MSSPLLAGIDAGGTSFKCLVARGPSEIVAEHKVSVGTNPQATLAECVEFIRAHPSVEALGIASFGPIDLDRESPSYGYVTSTPKKGWQNTDVLGFMKEALVMPIGFETDVNGALLAEHRWGAARGMQSAVYVTVGTGIGAGVMVNGHLLHGSMHPEAGHMLVPRHINDSFRGVCPFHKGCLEGLASGPALSIRAGADPAELGPTNVVWDMEAHYLAAMCVNLALLYSPECIVLGGGVMQSAFLLDRIRNKYLDFIQTYLGNQHDEIDEFIMRAALGTRAGALGGIVLAEQVLMGSTE